MNQPGYGQVCTYKTVIYTVLINRFESYLTLDPYIPPSARLPAAITITTTASPGRLRIFFIILESYPSIGQVSNP